MPRLAIDKDFLDDYSKLEKPVQNAVKDAIDKFAEHTHAGLHLEKLQRPRMTGSAPSGSTSSGAASFSRRTAATPTA